MTTARWEVEAFLQREQPEVMIICETKWKDEWGVPEIGMDDYDIWMKNRRDKGGGGVMIWTKKALRLVRVEIKDNKSEIVKVVVRKRKGGVMSYVGVYIPPLTTAWTRDEHERMLKDTIEELEEIASREKDVLIIGDFNCKQINWETRSCIGEQESWGQRLLNWAEENLLTQWIDCDTRFRGRDTPSRLDLLFTSDEEAIERVICECPLGRSDHILMEVTLKINIEVGNEEYKLERYRYNKADFEGLRKYFEEADWNRFDNEDDLHRKWNEFLKIYEDAVNEFVPKGRQTYKKGKEWFNRKCLMARNEKRRTWSRWRKERSERRWNDYVNARNESVKIIREEKRNYEKDIMEKCQSDPRLFYKHVNARKKKGEGITKLVVDGQEYTEVRSMAEVMNERFQSVFTEEEIFNLEDGDFGDSDLEVVIERERVLELMKDLNPNKAPGPDGISNWILKECSNQLVDKIQSLIQLSLLKGELPKDWKRANIVPIFKGGSRENPLNYRPVSLLSVVGKLCETLVKDTWTEHLEKTEVLTSHQYGFRKGSSCTSNLLAFYSKVIDTVQEREGWADGVYLDLKKAFDKVPHKRLLWKIKNYGGVRGRLLDWMKNYLRGREMRTVIRNEGSPWLEVTSGVPQGSVLGPIMFGIYVNDLVEGIGSYINLFADDAKLLRRVNNVDDCRKLQEDLDKVGEWGRKWQMEFNPKKCRVMEFGKSKRRVHWDYKMEGVGLVKTNEEVDLGVTVTEGLTPDRHIHKVTAKANNLLRRVKMAFTYLDKDMMRKIIVTMVRPILEYAAVVWSPHKKKNVRKLERVQRAATKMAPELRDLNYEERLKEMELGTLESRRERGDLINIFKMVNGLDRTGEDLLNRDTSVTRGHGRKLKKERCLRDIKKFSFPHRTVGMWNGLEEDIVNAASMHSFKARLDKIRYQGRNQ